MAAKAFLAGLLCMTLPETKGQPTEETLGGDAPLAADNVVVMSDLEDDEKEPIENGKQEKDEEKSAGQVQTSNGKPMVNGDAPMAADNVVAVDEVDEEEKKPEGQEKEKEEKNINDAPMAADNPVAADEGANEEKKKDDGEQADKEDSEVESTAF